MDSKIVTLIGGTGFLGRYVVKLLAQEGYTVRVVSRRPDAARHLKTAGEPGQVVLVSGNIARPSTILPHIEGTTAVVNLVGALYEKGSQRFSALHAQGPERIAKAAKSEGCKTFVQVSALGVDKAAQSYYARTKVLGEKAVRGAFHEATILRPSVIFGPEDNFYNQFARIAALAPALPLIGGGKTKFQPIYVGDVARAIVECVKSPATHGKTYELGGSQIFTFREILDYILTQTGQRCRLVTLPFGMATAIGAVAEFLPRPMLTRDQVRLLKYDNVVSEGAHILQELGITPTPVAAIVPGYLARYRGSNKNAA